MKKLLLSLALLLSATQSFASGYPWVYMEELSSSDLNAAFAARATFLGGPLPPYTILLGNGNGDITYVPSTGTAGYALVSTGPSSPPQFQAVGSAVTLGANTFTGTQTFPGGTHTPAIIESNIVESIYQTAVAGGPSSVQPVSVGNNAVNYFSGTAARNWTLNVMWDGATTFNSVTQVGYSVTLAVLVAQGSPAYYMSGLQIDGAAQTCVWLGGAPTAGHASGIDSYTITIIKTATTPTYAARCSLASYY